MAFKLFGTTITGSQKPIPVLEGEEVDESAVEAIENVSSSFGEVLLQEGTKEASIFEEIKVEAKSFSCRNVEEGYMFKEFHKRWEREILISKAQLVWMMETLAERSREFGRCNGKIYAGSSELGLISVNEKENDWGRYLLFHFGKGMFLIFPAGFKGKEWERVSVWMSKCILMIIQVDSEVSSNCEIGVLKNSFHSQLSSHEPVELDKKIFELNFRLENVLKELRFFRCAVSKICSPEEEEDDSYSVTPTEDEGDRCSEFQRGEERVGYENALSWEEQMGCFDQLGRTEASNLPSTDWPIREDKVDFDCGPLNVRLAGELMLTDVQLETEVINEGGVKALFEFESTDVTACFSEAGLGISTANPNSNGLGLVKGLCDGQLRITGPKVKARL